MASSKEYLEYITEQLGGADNDITYRAMMGEFIIYYKDRILGGVYDGRFLIKPVESAIKLMPDAVFEKPYEGAKEMLLVENVEDTEFLRAMISQIYEELPKPKPKKKKKSE